MNYKINDNWAAEVGMNLFSGIKTSILFSGNLKITATFTVAFVTVFDAKTHLTGCWRALQRSIVFENKIYLGRG
ncbi:MAG: hypothetical protein R3E73_05610 [Porticoccaceae bacterium]